MSSSPSAQRVTLPPSSANTLTPALRSQINAALLASNQIPAIQAALLHECQASGFITALRARVLELLRSGQCASYGELMTAVMEEIRSGGGLSGEDKKSEEKNGINGVGKEPGLRVPRKVVEEGVGAVKKALEQCVVFGDEEAK